MTQSTQMAEELDDCFVQTAASIMKYYVNKEERKKMLEELRDIIIENCIESAKIDTANEITERLTSTSDPDRNVKSILKEYQKAISKIKINPSKEKRLLDYDHQIERLLETNEAAQSDALDNTDADLRLTATNVNVIDPISKVRMTDPVRNTVCGHVYDRESLKAVLMKNKNTRCPVVGCTSTDYISLRKCRTDVVTKTYLEENPA